MAQNKLTVIDQLQTIAWFNFVTQTSKMNVNSIGWALSQGKISGRGSNKCYQWRDGKHRPHKDSVAKVEALVPGSLNVFYHPLWKILQHPEEIKTLDDVDKLLINLPRSRSALFKKVNGSPNKLIRICQPIDSEFACKLGDTPHDYSQNSADNLDLLAMHLLLVHEAKILEASLSQGVAIRLFEELKSQFKNIPELKKIEKLLFQYIEGSQLWTHIEPSETLAHKQFMREIELAIGMDTDPPYQWTQAQEAMLGTMSDAALAKRLGLTEAMIWFRRYNLGILEFYEPAEKIRK